MKWDIKRKPLKGDKKTDNKRRHEKETRTWDIKRNTLKGDTKKGDFKGWHEHETLQGDINMRH